MFFPPLVGVDDVIRNNIQFGAKIFAPRRVPKETRSPVILTISLLPCPPFWSASLDHSFGLHVRQKSILYIYEAVCSHRNYDSASHINACSLDGPFINTLSQVEENYCD